MQLLHDFYEAFMRNPDVTIPFYVTLLFASLVGMFLLIDAEPHESKILFSLRVLANVVFFVLLISLAFVAFYEFFLM